MTLPIANQANDTVFNKLKNNVLLFVWNEN